MPWAKTFTALALFGITAVIGVSGCGSSSNSEPSSAVQTSGASTETKAPPEPNVTVISTATTKNPKLGAKVLVNSEGQTLYAFSKDPKNTFHPHCVGPCESTWPPLILTGSAPVAGKEALTTQLGAIKRADGKLQVDYAGSPLYTYSGDKRPGDALGNGVSSFGGTWHALTAQGKSAP
jgi:predicted lipoprotein with Yx(FWY)xxD motif